MRKLVIGLIGASALAFASAASAQVAISSTPGSSTYTGPTPTYDFDTALTTPPTTGGTIEPAGNHGLNEAQPMGSTGNYYAAGPDAGSPGFIDFSSIAAIGSLSFIWGSADTYNTLDVMARDGVTVLASFSGSMFNGGVGCTLCADSNPIVTLTFSGADQTNFGGLRLSSSQNAFEVDNFVVTGVPEPATWALMLLGFGGIGFAMRRSRKPALAQLA
jgi:hypothetical protein